MARRVIDTDDEDYGDGGYDAAAPAADPPAPTDDDSDDHIGVRPRRKHTASLVEEDPLAELDEFKDDLSMSDGDKDEYAPPANGRAARRSRRARADDDEEFMDDYVSDDDDFMEKLQEKAFIASDDDGDDFGYSRPSRKRKRPSRRPRSPRKRLTRASVVADDDESYDESKGGDDDDIQKEIDDLYDSSPMASPTIKHKLRERQKEVNYTIPPPLANGDLDRLAARPVARSRGRPRGGAAPPMRKLLFPTAGPFGGADVISLFGKNVPPAATGLLNDDSDSSDDEIVAMDGTTSGKPSHGPVGGAGALISAGGGGNATGKVKSTLSDTDPLGVDMDIDFSVVGGLDAYIDQLKEMVALPLSYPELYQNFAITPPRGVLFHGPPGTGKTLMARALAASCSTADRKITFYMRKGADCLSKWVGEAERQLRLLFDEAKKNQPAIIFFDEIDGLAPVRSSKQEQIHASIVSTLLALMDGMDNRGQVVVIGATNRPDAVDPALRRPGRFDREFYFGLPDMAARRDILAIHTRKWTPAVAPEMVATLARLTKGYGGADLRALCTEAALNAIQRKYPQIYRTSDKLRVHPASVKVVARDFMKALDKIVPSSARSASSGSAPLPEGVAPLLRPAFDEVVKKVARLLPTAHLSTHTGPTVGMGAEIASSKPMTALEDALYYDPSVTDADGGFARQHHLKQLEQSRVCKPHLLVAGPAGNGQQYVSAAILNHLEGFQVQSLDLGALFGESNRTPEAAIIQCFIEARRHQPSVVLIPNFDIWSQVVSEAAQATLVSMLRNLRAAEQVLLLAVADGDPREFEGGVAQVFGYGNHANNVVVPLASAAQRRQFFGAVLTTLAMPPSAFINDVANRPRRKLRELPVVKQAAAPKSSERRRLKQQEYQDTKLKNTLKIRLAGLMELFKTRYKRFKKPVIDDAYLVHLFEPSVLAPPPPEPGLEPQPFAPPPYEVLYEKSTDPAHEHMIRELATGNYYYNMDLDIIEERLWNGFYSEPKQFLRDIRMMVKDSKTAGDRERILKSEEMLTNAQFAIDEFATPEFLKECKAMREREVKRHEKFLEEQKAAAAAEVEAAEAEAATALDVPAEVATVSGNGVVGDNVGYNDMIAGDPSDQINQPVSEPVQSEEKAQIEGVAQPEEKAQFEGVGQPTVGQPGIGQTIAEPETIAQTIPKPETVAQPETTQPIAQPDSVLDQTPQPSVVQPPAHHAHTAGALEVPATVPYSGEYAQDVEMADVPKSPSQTAPEPPVKPEGPASISALIHPTESTPAPELPKKTIQPVVPPAGAASAQAMVTPTPQPESPPAEEDYVSEESEYEELPDANQELVLDRTRADAVFEKLVASTTDYPVDRLEATLAGVMDIVWNSRARWDKTSTLQELEDYLT
ncbi:ATPase histone chaperone Yta7p [Diutina catenulata]